MWSEEQTELCVKLWNEGHSATEVARRMACGFSRNAVIGKIHRLGLAHRSRTTRVNRMKVFRIKKARAKRKSNTPRFKNVEAIGRSISRPKPLTTPLPPEPVRPDKLFSLTEITDCEDKDHVKLCRFIYGDPRDHDSGYCGCEAAPGSSYCPWHHAVIFTAPPARMHRPSGSFKTHVKNLGHPGYTRKMEVVS